MQYREIDDELSHECEMVFGELVVMDKESEFLFRSTLIAIKFKAKWQSWNFFIVICMLDATVCI